MNKRYRHWLRIIIWISVAIYTLSLPHIIIVYNTIVSHFSPNSVEIIPKMIVFILVIFYAAFGYLHKRNLRHIGYIIPCVIFISAVLYIEENPNKEIHVPEYIVMSWLLLIALSIDYQGKGISMLVSLCATLLGIVDELLQGIHPNRSYGWEDMGINSISALVGVLLLEGLRNEPQGNWNWLINLKKQKTSITVGLLGLLGAVLQCIYLMEVKANGKFWSVYPPYLLVWNALFPILVFAIIYSFYHRYHMLRLSIHNGLDLIPSNADITSYLWIFVPLLILFIIHLIVIFVALFGWKFR